MIEHPDSSRAAGDDKDSDDDDDDDDDVRLMSRNHLLHCHVLRPDVHGGHGSQHHAGLQGDNRIVDFRDSNEGS